MSGEKNVFEYITTEGKRAGNKFTALEYLQKNTGVFNQNGMIPQEEVETMKERAKANKGNIWHGFISFNAQESEKIDNPDKCIRLIKDIFPTFLRESGLNPNNMDLMCALHLDRPHHLHIHFVFWEKGPKCRKKDGSLGYRQKGKINESAIDNMFVRLGLFVDKKRNSLYETRDTCLKCGDSYEDNFTDLLAHTYADIVIAPTCTNSGYTTHFCVECGTEYTDDYVEPLGHSFVEEVINATCLTDGYTVHTCSACDYSYTDGMVLAFGHNYIAVVTAPTCTEQGFTTHTCEHCSDSFIDTETEATGHTYGAETIAPTCTAYGFVEHKCENCESRYVTDYVNPLRNLCYRKEWKYMGVWERSPEKQRLHFHGLFYIPENAMVGELFEKTDYDLRNHRMRTTVQNTFFNKKYGRSDFEEILPIENNLERELSIVG